MQMSVKLPPEYAPARCRLLGWNQPADEGEQFRPAARTESDWETAVALCGRPQRDYRIHSDVHNNMFSKEWPPRKGRKKNCYLDCYLQSVNGCCYFKTARQKWGPVKKKELWQLRGWERQTGDGVRYNRTCWRRRRRRKKTSKRGDVSK